ncbi:MAG: type II toxin-antitoxin system Phd/YefM family antitoxin [Firmicutes bacterium]|nr:type II toxin-antitoxin system Phd/YefM family antitoxin [Bacillota bacterium]
MKAVNYTQFRENLKANLDMVCEDCELIYITRKDSRNAVVLSEESYNNLLENVYVMGSKANYDWLMESKAQLEKGGLSVRELIDPDGPEDGHE